MRLRDVNCRRRWRQEHKRSAAIVGLRKALREQEFVSDVLKKELACMTGKTRAQARAGGGVVFLYMCYVGVRALFVCALCCLWVDAVW
jgi:hypothetical protein